LGGARVKIVLVFPPLADPTQPYSSLPALTAFLRERTRHTVLQRDANIEFMNHVLTRRGIRAAARRIAGKLDHFGASDVLEGPDSREYSVLTSASLKAPIVSERIEQAIAQLKSRETFRDLRRLESAKRTVAEAIEVLSASWFPFSLRLSELADATPATVQAISQWAGNPAASPFPGFLRERFVPRIERLKPHAVGISITYRSQILAAAALALILKQRLPATAVILGGQIASCWYGQLEAVPDIFQWCDYLIPFEGESALASLLSSLETGRSLDAVPNLVHRRCGRTIKNPVVAEDINALPAPDYRGLPLKLYLSSEPVFLLSTTRGCYWSGCHFCSVSPSTRGRFRRRDPELVINDIRLLQARHAAQCVMFGDDCVPPRTLKELSRLIRAAGIDVSWQCELRFEAALTDGLIQHLAAAGCRNLVFGLESYAPRVLKLMNKGVRHAEIRRILDSCRRHGIAFNLQLFFGFPGETGREARETADFVTGQMHGAATVSAGIFELHRGSPIARNPSLFGISMTEDGQNALAVRLDHRPQSSHAAEMVQLLRREFLARTDHPHVSLSIDAHTLLFAHEAGVAQIAQSYYRPKETGGSAAAPVESDAWGECRLVRRALQVIGMFSRGLNGGERGGIVVYDYELDKAVELSRFALWVLRQFDTAMSVGEIAGKVAAATSDSQDAVVSLESLHGVIAELMRRGLLIRASGGQPPLVSTGGESVAARLGNPC